MAKPASPRRNSVWTAPYLLLSLAVLAWAGNWVMARGLRFDAPPVAMAFWRWLLAAVVLLPAAYPHLRLHWREVLGSWKILCLLAVLTTAANHIPIHIGLRETTATNGALLYASSPIMIVGMSWLFFRQGLGFIGILGALVSLIGVIVIVTRGDYAVLQSLNVNPGDGWVLLGTLGWAAYTAFLRKRPGFLHPLEFLFVISAVGVVAMVPLYAWELASGHHLTLNAASICGIAYMGFFSTVAAYIFWNRGVREVGPARAAPFMYLMPVFTPILAFIFLGESMHLYHLIGIVLIFLGISMTEKARR
jgi:drug/metabolite transporter (DMT)-like permease